MLTVVPGLAAPLRRLQADGRARTDESAATTGPAGALALAGGQLGRAWEADPGSGPPLSDGDRALAGTMPRLHRRQPSSWKNNQPRAPPIASGAEGQRILRSIGPAQWRD